MKNMIWLFLLVLFSYVSSFAEETNISSQIEKISREARKANTNLNYYEKMYLNLIATNTPSISKGEVYFAILDMYSDDLKNNYRKVIYYSQETLKYDLPTLRKCDAYYYWGNAIQVGKKQSKINDNFGDPIVPYLKGLSVVAQNLKIEKPQPLPRVGKYTNFSSDPNDPINIKYEKEMAVRKEIDVQNKLLAYRPLFRHQIFLIRPEMKSGTSKMNTAVKQVVADTNSADKIIQYLLRPVTNEMMDAFQDTFVP